MIRGASWSIESQFIGRGFSIIKSEKLVQIYVVYHNLIDILTNGCKCISKIHKMWVFFSSIMHVSSTLNAIGNDDTSNYEN